MNRKVKILAIFFIVLFIILGGFIFFLKPKIQKDVFNFLNENNNFIITDLNLMTIDTLRFKFVIKDVVIFPNSKNFKVKTDEITCYYDPFSKKFRFHFTGKKVFIGSDDTELYVNNPNILAEFDQKIFAYNFNAFTISIIIKNTDFFYTKTNELLASTELDNFKITGSLNSKLKKYTIKTSLNFEGLTFVPNVLIRYYKDFIKSIFSRFIKLEELFDIDTYLLYCLYKFEYLEKLINITSPVKYSFSWGGEIDQHYFKQVLSIRTLWDLIDFFTKNFDFLSSQYNLYLKESLKNSAFSIDPSIELINNGTKFILRLYHLGGIRYFSDKKEKIKNIEQQYLLNKINILFNNGKKLSLEDCEGLAKALISISHSSYLFALYYDLIDSNFNYKIRNIINKYKIKLEGEGKDRLYKGVLRISNFSNLLEDLKIFYIEALVPILSKLLSPNYDIILEKEVIETIFLNILKFFASVNKGEELHDELKVYINYDLNKGSCTFNNKTLTEILLGDNIK